MTLIYLNLHDVGIEVTASLASFIGSVSYSAHGHEAVDLRLAVFFWTTWDLTI